MADEAARLAERMRAAKKAQSLSATAIAREIERLAGSRPTSMWVSRRLHGTSPMIRLSDTCGFCGRHTPIIDPMLRHMVAALGLELHPLLADVLGDRGLAQRATVGTVNGQRRARG